MRCLITGSSHHLYYPKEAGPRVCLCGGPATELDHTLAIGVAKRLGARFYIRALLPENLRWLCHDCHVAKTTFDRTFMRSLDGKEPAAKRPAVRVVDPRQLRLDIGPLAPVNQRRTSAGSS